MLFLVAGFTAWQALQVRESLDVVAVDLSRAADQVTEQDTDGASASIDSARAAAADAERHSSGPVWAVASRLPLIGDDVTAVRTVASVSSSLTSGALPELVTALDGFGPESLQPRDGRIRIRPIVEVAPRLSAGAEEIDAAHRRVEGLETDGLLGAIATPVRDLEDKLARAASLSGTAATAAEVLPPMLGSEGDRTYLMVFQTNAAVRALGGMVGAHALVRVEDGKPSIVSQGRPGDLGRFDEDFIDLTREEKALFTTRMSVFPQNATGIPDFPRSARILTQMWDERRPEKLDGVVALDPVALGYVLAATGPVELSSGQRLTAQNAADYLLNGVYQQVPDPAAQNVLFDEAALRVFETLMAGSLDAQTLVDGLARAAGERRLMVWSAHQDEQERFADTSVAGALPTTESATPEIGMYLSGSAADKLGYYLDYDVDVTPTSCGSTGAQAVDVEVSLTSIAKPGGPFSESIIGPGLGEGVERGTMRNTVFLYGPVAGTLLAATLDDAEAPMQEATHEGRPVGVVTFDLAPGETRQLSYSLRTGPGQDGDPRLVTTPGSRTTGVGEVAASAC